MINQMTTFFSYEFQYENSVLVGGYRHSTVEKSGKSACKTGLIFDNLDFHPVDNSPEGVARSYINEMVRTGDLIETEGDDGERYLHLPNRNDTGKDYLK